MHNVEPMDHARAVRERLADRYLLKELQEAEAVEFEKHYFECEECAAAVEAGDLFIVNAREVLGEVPHQAPQPSFWERFGVRWTWPGALMPALSAALAVVALYQGAVVIPRLNAPRVLPTYQLVGASRGEAPVIDLRTGTTAFALAIDPPPDSHFATFQCELQTEGKSLFRVTAEAPPPGQPITVLVPAKGLRPGSYQLVLKDPQGGRNLSIAPFEARFK